jgi:hypothetical protein
VYSCYLLHNTVSLERRFRKRSTTQRCFRCLLSLPYVSLSLSCFMLQSISTMTPLLPHVSLHENKIKIGRSLTWPFSGLPRAPHRFRGTHNEAHTVICLLEDVCVPHMSRCCRRSSRTHLSDLLSASVDATADRAAILPTLCAL